MDIINCLNYSKLYTKIKVSYVYLYLSNKVNYRKLMGELAILIVLNKL